MVSDKKPYHFSLSEEVHRQIRLLGAEYHCAPGEVVSRLLRFTKAHEKYKDEQFKERFERLFHKTMSSPRKSAYRRGDPEDQKPFVAEDFFAGLPPTDHDKEQSR